MTATKLMPAKITIFDVQGQPAATGWFWLQPSVYEELAYQKISSDLLPSFLRRDTIPTGLTVVITDE